MCVISLYESHVYTYILFDEKTIDILLALKPVLFVFIFCSSISDIIFNKVSLQYVHEVIIKQSKCWYFFVIRIAIARKADDGILIYCIRC